MAFAAANDHCVPLLAEVHGRIVATGVGTANGSVGWLGSVFVAPEVRGRGLGRAMTQAVLDELAARGCGTTVLVATADGRRLYSRMGFETQTRYRIYEAPGLDAPEPAPKSEAFRVRPFRPADLAALLALDTAATGEDRGHALERLAAPETTRVAIDAADAVTAFLVRPPWGGGATIASTPDAALAIIAARRRAAGPAGRVRVGVLDENSIGIERLEAAGFAPSWSAPRMVRGDRMEWAPERIWGQFNHAMG